MRHSWRCVPVPPDISGIWIVVDSRPKTGWVRADAISPAAADIVALQDLEDPAFRREMDKLYAADHGLNSRWARMVAVEVMRKRTARATGTMTAVWARAATHQDENCT
jgi:hypothetical protein